MSLTIPITRSLGLALAFLLVTAALYLTPTHAQQTAAAAQKQTAGTGPVNFTATSANVGASGIPVKISILRWSTDEERNPIVAALDPAAQAAAQAAAAAGRGAGAGGARGGRGGRGGARGDQGAAAQADQDDAADQDGAAQGARGRGGRGGDAAPAKPVDPITTLTSALAKAPTVGYLWTNEVVGYSIKYAYRTPLPDGGERIILATDRRLGAGTAGWKQATGTPTDYEFTLLELKIDAKGLGEGKASLTSKVIFDNGARTVALDNYAAAPAILQNIKR
jgi:hypothetical protein